MTRTPHTGPRRPDSQYLTFFLGEEEYGLEVLKVQEIIGLTRITPVPRTPDYLRGLINLRGRVVPVMDLRLKLGMPAVPPTEETCIVIVECRNRHTGLIVDKVSDVRGIESSIIEPAPELGTDVAAEFILGMGKCPEGLKILIDIDRVLTAEDEPVLDKVVES